MMRMHRSVTAGGVAAFILSTWSSSPSFAQDQPPPPTVSPAPADVTPAEADPRPESGGRSPLPDRGKGRSGKGRSPRALSVDFGAALRGPGAPLSTYGVARVAAARGPAVAAAQAEAEQAEAEADAAESRLLPQVELSARYTWLSPIDNDPLVPASGDADAARQAVTQLQDPVAQGLWTAQLDQLDALSAATIEIPQNQFGFRAVVRYPVSHAFAQILPLVAAAEHAAEARSIGIEVAKQDTALQAVETYLSHGLARGALVVAETSVVQAREDLRQAEGRRDAGAGSRPDVLRFRAQLAAAERRVAERRAAVDASGVALQTLLGLERSGPFAVGEDLTATPRRRFTAPAAEWVAEAYERRAELRVLDALRHAREDQVTSETSAYYPRLDVQAQADYANPNTLFVPPGDRFRGSVQLSAVLSWSPDAAWTGQYRRKAARRDVDRVAAQVQRLREGIRIEVAGALAEYRAGFEAMRAARRQVAAAREAYAAQRRAYELGAARATDVIAAEQQLAEARLGVLSTGVEIRRREQRLRRALGRDLSVRPAPPTSSRRPAGTLGRKSATIGRAARR